jgi:hypothetical protein
MKKLSKNFGISKMTVESMIDACACGCSCMCPSTCQCAVAINYAALSGAVLLIGYRNNASSSASTAAIAVG